MYDKILEDNPTKSERTDFSTPFTTNTAKNTANTLYKAQEENTDVYYFAGIDGVAAHCEYNDKPIIDVSTSKLNETTCTGKIQLCHLKEGKYLYLGNSSCSWYAGTVVESEVKWIPDFSKPINNWVKFGKNASNQDLYWRIIRTNADGSIRMVFAGNSPDTTEAYIGISPVSNIQSNDTMYVGYKYGTSGSLANNRLNTNDSTIKKFIESWYKTNLTNYTKYLSNDAVYCNDRSIGSGTYSVYGTTEFEYGASARLDANPTYTCPSTYDAFSVNNSLAKLTYPIGLMTADEVVFAGGVYHSTGSLKPWYNRNSKTGDPGTDPSYSVVGSHWYWSMSPAGDTGSNGNGYMIIYPQLSGSLSGAAVRPVISLKGNLIVASGNGSVSSPYQIVEN